MQQQREVSFYQSLRRIYLCRSSFIQSNGWQQGYLRTVEATRSISKITTNFFDNLDAHTSKLSKIMEESQSLQDHQLCELQRKFEVIPLPRSSFKANTEHLILHQYS